MLRRTQIDLTYLRMCREYAGLSRCLSRRVGALLVNPDGCIIGFGVNGPPRGVKHCQPVDGACPRKAKSQSLLKCPAVHAEVNAILACSRTNNSTVEATLYVWPLAPCKDCAAISIQAGIRAIVSVESDWYDDLAEGLLAQAGIPVEKYPMEMLGQATCTE